MWQRRILEDNSPTVLHFDFLHHCLGKRRSNGICETRHSLYDRPVFSISVSYADR